MANVLPAPQSGPFNQQLVADSILSVCTPKKGGLSREEQEEIKEIVQGAFQSLVGEIQKRDIAIQKLAGMNKDLIQRIEQITHDHEILKKKLESEKAEMGNLTSSIEDLKGKNLLSEARYRELLDETKRLKIETSDLQSKSSDLKTQYDKLNAENARLNAKSKDLEVQTSKLTDNYTKLDGENRNLLNDSDKLKREYGQLEVKYGQLEKETTSWSVRYSQLNDNYAKVHRVVDEALKNNEESYGRKFIKFIQEHEEEITILGKIVSPFEWPDVILTKLGF